MSKQHPNRKPTRKQLLTAEGVAQGKSLHQAALDAGYTPSSAKSLPYDPRDNARLQALIEERSKRAMAAARIHTDEITGMLVEIARGSIADVLPTNKILKRAKKRGVDHLIREIEITPIKMGTRERTLPSGRIVHEPIIREKTVLKMYSRLDAIAQARDNFGMKQEPRSNTFDETRRQEIEKHLERICEEQKVDRKQAAVLLRDALDAESPLIPVLNKYVN